jgi:hypothetical protein
VIRETAIALAPRVPWPEVLWLYAGVAVDGAAAGCLAWRCRRAARRCLPSRVSAAPGACGCRCPPAASTVCASGPSLSAGRADLARNPRQVSAEPDTAAVSAVRLGLRPGAVGVAGHKLVQHGAVRLRHGRMQQRGRRHYQHPARLGVMVGWVQAQAEVAVRHPARLQDLPERVGAKLCHWACSSYSRSFWLRRAWRSLERALDSI